MKYKKNWYVEKDNIHSHWQYTKRERCRGVESQQQSTIDKLHKKKKKEKNFDFVFTTGKIKFPSMKRAKENNYTLASIQSSSSEIEKENHQTQQVCECMRSLLLSLKRILISCCFPTRILQF